MENNIFFNKTPLVLNTELATIVGLNGAIILQQLHYWLQKSNIEHEGKKWVYNSYEEWQKQFNFWSVETIKRTFTELKKRGLIEKKKLSKNKFDKTNYYTINYHKIDILADEVKMTQSIVSDCPHREGQNDPIGSVKMTSCNNTEITTEITTEKKKELKNKFFNSKKDEKFSFILARNTSYENLSEEYQNKLKAFCIQKDGLGEYEAFLDFHISKGNKFKDWSRAYITWLRNVEKYGGNRTYPIRVLVEGKEAFMDISGVCATYNNKEYELIDLEKYKNTRQQNNSFNAPISNEKQRIGGNEYDRVCEGKKLNTGENRDIFEREAIRQQVLKDISNTIKRF